MLRLRIVRGVELAAAGCLAVVLSGLACVFAAEPDHAIVSGYERFADAEGRGYTIHGGPEEAVTTRPSLITRWPDRAMKLDWFLTRGLHAGAMRIETSLDGEGKPMSDHDLIVLQIKGLA